MISTIRRKSPQTSNQEVFSKPTALNACTPSNLTQREHRAQTVLVDPPWMSRPRSAIFRCHGGVRDAPAHGVPGEAGSDERQMYIEGQGEEAQGSNPHGHYEPTVRSANSSVATTRHSLAMSRRSPEKTCKSLSRCTPAGRSEATHGYPSGGGIAWRPPWRASPRRSRANRMTV